MERKLYYGDMFYFGSLFLLQNTMLRLKLTNVMLGMDALVMLGT